MWPLKKIILMYCPTTLQSFVLLAQCVQLLCISARLLVSNVLKTLQYKYLWILFRKKTSVIRECIEYCFATRPQSSGNALNTVSKQDLSHQGMHWILFRNKTSVIRECIEYCFATRPQSSGNALNTVSQQDLSHQGMQRTFIWCLHKSVELKYKNLHISCASFFMNLVKKWTQILFKNVQISLFECPPWRNRHTGDGFNCDHPDVIDIQGIDLIVTSQY